MKEEPTFHCSICNRTFGNKESLEMHNKAKHSAGLEKKEVKTNSINFKKIRNWGIFIVVLGLIVWGIYAMMGNTGYGDLPVTEINIGSHQNIALHIHSDLEIIIDGNETEIPANIGVYPGIMRPLHTHDDTGEIHIEGPYARDFTLGEFFDVWNKEFNQTCIFEYCTDKGELKMSVDGQESTEFENIILRDGLEIVIEYNSF